MLLAIYLFTVLTPEGQLLTNATLLLIEVSPAQEARLSQLLLYLTPGVVLLMALVIGWLGRHRGRLRLGICLGLGLIVGLALAEVLKIVLPRPDLATLTNPLVGEGDSLPSGTAVICVSFVLGLTLISSSRWRPWIAWVGGMIAVLIMLAAFLADWHRIPDLVAGAFLAGGVMVSAWWLGGGGILVPRGGQPPARV